MGLTSDIRALALEHGFDVAGFAAPDLPQAAGAGLRGFLDQQHHGDMQWMEEKADRRASPREIWPEVQSVIVLGQNYAPAENPLDKLSQRLTGNISCYAQGEDYHDVIKKKLKRLARAIAEKFACDVKVFVDTAPVMEKPLAEQAGLGWQGKHTCVVSRAFGSWLFLGEIFSTLPLPPDAPETDHCGTCTSCLDICPTHAFNGPRELDARKCISYLTIEHKGHIAARFRKAIGNRIYGCDDCLAVCPWNKFAQDAREAAYHPREALKSPLLAHLVTLDDAGFRALFTKSPVKRIGRDRFIRNVLIAIGNSGDASQVARITTLLSDPSPLVRAMAVWALAQLASPPEYYKIKEEYLPHESDPDVALEWKGEAA
jgi:epoxyqueuosine reductase